MVVMHAFERLRALNPMVEVRLPVRTTTNPARDLASSDSLVLTYQVRAAANASECR